jgi:uncharacterized protein (DUF779 family)
MNRIEITEKAALVLEELKVKHGELIFHQSGGCCDGSAPMLIPKEDFYIDETDVLLGELCDINYYMNIDQYEYWKHTHLTIDVTEGRGSSFSLEISLGLRFIIHSRLLNNKEIAYFNIR